MAEKREPKIQKIPFKEIEDVFDVRRKPDTPEAASRRDNRILDFAEKLAAGVEFPPIIVTPAGKFPGNMYAEVSPDHYIVIDGRTRLAAIDLESKEGENPFVACEVKTFTRVWDAFGLAFRSNYATAEPMTHEETADIVTKLWNGGLKEKAIHEKLGVPVGQITKIISGVRESKLQTRQSLRQRLIQAGHAVKSGAQVDEAARRFEVDEQALRKILATTGQVSISGLKSAIRRAARTYTGSLRVSCSKAFDAFQMDKITAGEVLDLLSHAETVLQEIQRKTTECQKLSEKVLNAEKGTVVLA